MFGENQMQATNAPMPNGIVGAQAQETGIVSTVKELVEAVQDNALSTRSLEDALGIANPEKETAPSPVPTSLIQTLRATIYRVRNTNEHLYQIIRHINS